MKFIERFSRKPSQQPQPADAAQAPLLMALEPRIMFDASVGVVAQDAAADVAKDTAKDSTSADKTAASAASAPSAASSAQNTQRQEVVFIDGQVANVGELLQGLSGNAEVVILDPNKDGLQQMADYLKGREGLDAIHLLSHGADGSVQMGNLWLSNANLSEHRAELESIGTALKADGDLMLYGCRVGETERGQAFIDQLAQITGADVAASADDTGAADLGGNWALERTSGTIGTTALGAQLQGYEALMAVSFSGDANATGPVLGTGQLSRMVVGDFNNDGRADILYQIGGDGTAWRFAAGNANGTFTVVDQAQSPFANVTLVNAASNGINYYAADFDKDGDIDLLGVVSGGAAYLYRNSNGVFSQETAVGFGGTQYNVRLVVGDFDGDGAADILYQPGNVDAGNSWRYARNNGDGTFTDVVQSASPFAAFTLGSYSSFNYRVLDFDGDGDLDIMWVSNGSKGTLYLNNGGTFTLGSTSNFPTTPYGGRTLWGDFDGDGDADVFWQDGTNGSEWKYSVNNGDGTFTTVTRAVSPFAGLNMVDFSNSNFRAGDFDGDGDLDVIGISATGSSYVYYQSGATPRLVSATPADDSLNVSPGANITLTFSESVSKGAGNIYIVRTSDNQIVQTIDVTSGQVSGSGTTWTIDPSDLVQGTAYAVRVDSKTFVNTDGKVYKGIYNSTALNFTTATVAAPVIANLNGDAVNYAEKSSGILIDQSDNAVVTDADSANFNGGSVRVSVTGGAVTNEDVLSILSLGTAAGQISVSGSNVLYGGVIIGAFTGGSGGNALVITLNASADANAVTALVRSLQYSNSNTTTPNTGARTLSVTVTDETGTTSTAAAVTVNILAVNDAPVVSVTGTNPTFTEDGSGVAVFSGASINTVEAGQTVVLMTFRVSNLANGASEKLVIDGSDVTLTAGTNLTTLNNGLSVSVSVNSGTATVTVTHAGLSTATAQTIVNNVAYRNDSNAPSGTSRTVTLSNVRDSGGTLYGGQNTTSPNIASVVTLVAVNDAPTLSGGPYVITSVNENTTSAAVAVSTVLAGATYADADAGAASGIAIIATVGRGTWQYSTDGTTWTAFGTVSTSSALLLDSSTQIRYVPDSANGENVSFTYRAWDRTSGAASTNGVPNIGDTTANGGTTAYSSGSAQATLIVTSVNDAPVITPVNPTLTGLTDSSTNNNGDAVSTLLGGVTDVDTGALKGIAVNGLTGTYGTWQFSTNNGTTWNDIGTVSDTAALLLRPADRVRFVPDGIHGETATITYRAWDQTVNQGYQGTTMNIAGSLGGANGYSSGSDTASVLVNAVNDAPIVTGSGGSLGWTEGNNVTSTPVVIDSALAISDPDGPGIASATISLGGTYVLGEDTLGFTPNPATMGNITGSWDAVAGTLTLTAAGGATQAQFQEALRSITYTNGSDTPTTTTRTVSIKVNDGTLDSNVVTRDVTITAVNDAPMISAPTNVTVTEDTLSPVTGIILSDADSSSGTLTLTVTAGTLSGISGSGVTVAGTGSALTLSGTLTAINNFIAAGSLKYTPVLNSNVSVTLGLSLDTASVTTDTRNLTLDITPVNDAPTISGPVSINVTEDVAKSMAGITFGDVDAGTGSVRVIFSVANGNGTFSASASSGVTVTNNGTNAITLEGTVADINTLVSNGRLTYLGALNATGVKTMSISINDNGNTGSGGALQVNANISLVIAAVNDAPVNNLPAAQTVLQDGSLVFSSANGNLITISDVDAGGNVIKLSLTSVNGQMTLGSIVGLSFATGDGSNDTAMVFTGTLAAINAALNGLTFTPQAGYNGTGSITFQSDDQGYSGSGGIKTDVDTLSIIISPINPKVTGVVAAPGSDGAHKVGDQIDIVVQFDNNVIVDQTSGTPTLLLETGAIDRQAVYLSGSGTTQLTFRYTVQAGDLSTDLDYASTAALSLNGAVLQSPQGYAAILTLPTLGGANSLAGQQAIVVDGVAPSIGNIVLPGDANYRLGQNLDFTVNFSEAVNVSTAGGTPRIEVTLDTGGTAYAEYVSGSGTSALVFRLVVASGQQDSNGITVGSSIQLNGGSMRDAAGNDSAIAFSPGNSSGVLVDGVVPSVASVSVPANGSYKAGDVLTFTVNASEAVFTSGSPRLALDIGGSTRYASLVPGSSSGATLVFQYTVQAGDSDADGIALGASLDLNGGAVKDSAGNDLALALNSVGSTTAVLVDTSLPTATSIARNDVSPTGAGSFTYTVTFSEAVTHLDTSDFTLVFTGTAHGSIESISSVDGRHYTVVVGSLSGAGLVRLDLNPGTDIADAAGNLVAAGLVGESYSVDRVAPTVTGVDVPLNGTYVAGQQLDFTVHMSEAVQLDTSNGSPRLEVTLDNGGTVFADYLSGSGTGALVFRLTVSSGQLDATGIRVGNALQLNGATLRDAVGNDAQTGLNGLPATDGVLIDAVAPSVASVALPLPGTYKAGDVLRFTVNASEPVIIDTSTGTPQFALTLDGVTRYAQYVSGSGGAALVFEYRIQPGDNAGSGIALAASVDLNGASARDAAGNAMDLALNNPGNGSSVVIDTHAPSALEIVRVDTTPTSAGAVRYTVTFDEGVCGVDSGDFTLAFSGSASGRIASVEQVNGRTYVIVVDNLAGIGNLRLDLNASGTGIVDGAGNPITGGLAGNSYAIDRVAPAVSSVSVPASGSYVAGQSLDFTVNTDEAVLVDTGSGTPRLAITLDNGRVVYADYLAGSGGSALTFRLMVTSGMAGNSHFGVAANIDLNGASMRDALGNDAQTALNNVGDLSGILVDARAPRPIGIVVDGPVLPSDRTLSFTLTFDEAVSGVDAADFSVLGTGSATGVLQSVQRIDAQTYRVVVGDLRGQGTLALSLSALNSGIQDAVGNQLAVNLVGQAQTLQSQDVGDLQYRLDPPQSVSQVQTLLVQPQAPTLPSNTSVSPLVPPSLFEVRSVGGDLQPLGTIFLGNASSAPSFIAQVFGSSDSAAGISGQGGFLGFGGDSAGVFGSSTLASIFSHDVPGVNEMSVFNGNHWRPADINQGLRGVFGAPTFGQQLQHINEADQRQVRELANALAQPTQIGQQA
ncbi:MULTISPECIES: DUF4347 domain-containing protein [Pseudomonas]|nr:MULTISPECIES: DUF4347 domain-containing protein [Pseudomonas]MCE1113821.1 DUF4347 domain-containing protein [Pseudomonas sp. NMI795_08]